MNYEQHAENGFADLDRAKLREACKELGLSVGGNESEDSMRRKLCTAMGRAAPEAKEPVKLSQKPVTGMPNLSPDGGEWGGRWYYITVNATNPKLTTCPVGWQGNYINLPLREEVKVIAPHYFSLRDAIGEKISQRQYKDPETGVTMYEDVKHSFAEFIISQARVDPETAHLPCDYVEYFQMLEKQSPNLAKYSKRQLAFIFSRLYDHVKEADILKMDEDALRDKILTLIKPGYGAELLSFEEAVA